MKQFVVSVGLLSGLLACSSKPGSVGQHHEPSRKVAQVPDKFMTDDIVWDFQPGEVTRLCDQFIEQTEVNLRHIGKLPEGMRTFESTLLDFETTMADFDRYTSPLVFAKDVHTVESIQKESEECAEKTANYVVEVWLRPELYNAIKDIKVTGAAQKRLKSETVKAFENNGLKLSDDKRAQLQTLQQKDAALSLKFSNNIKNDTTSVKFTAEELKGAEQNFLDRLKKDGDKYIVTTKSPDYLGVIENVTVPETRRKMAVAYNTRASENIPILTEVIGIRQQIAELLGFKTWADYRTSNGRMAKSGDQVWKFINDLKGKLSIANQADMKMLADFKKTIAPQGGELTPYDLPYLLNQYKKKNFKLDDEVIKEYFPSDQTVEKMFQLYSKLLGVTYEKVEGASVWAAGVTQYRIRDTASKKEIAFFYADFLPRERKYEHAAAFPVRPGRALGAQDGSYLKPIAAIVANFTPPSPGKPSMLTHDEVATLFHEFGHIMHQTLTKAPYASLSGTSVARDFVEAPSQMLENWVWDKGVLDRLSGHYTDAKRKLPADLLKQMLKVRDFYKAGFYTRQLYYGTIDMTYHSNPGPSVNTTAIQHKLYKEMVGINPLPESKFEASFGHLMGYSAGYYGYIWSEVFAEDMFTVFKKKGLLSSEAGMRYRKKILEQGGMKDADVLLVEFLGRKPSNAPFFKRLGVK